MKFTYRINKENKQIPILVEKLKANFEFDDQNPEYIFVFGGDGTMLRAVHEFESKIEKITFIGVNFGTLGFYADFTTENFDNLILMIKNKEYDIIKLPLIEYKVTSGNKAKRFKGIALNEVTLISPIKTMAMDVYINNNYFESFRGTGLVVSTPSGSTAYNKSLGGSIIDVNLKAMQLTEIASINNRIYKTIGSSMILSENSTITLDAKKYFDMVMTIDNLAKQIEPFSKLTIKLSNKSVHLVTMKNHSFFKRVKSAFLE